MSCSVILGLPVLELRPGRHCGREDAAAVAEQILIVINVFYEKNNSKQTVSQKEHYYTPLLRIIILGNSIVVIPCLSCPNENSVDSDQLASKAN